MSDQNLIIAITGASGAVYGVRLLEMMRETEIKTHLIISKSAQITLNHETNCSLRDVQKLADYHYASGDIAATISSGSFKTMGMIIAPCSVRTVGEIAAGIGSTLVTRAADVVLKENRKLVLMVRETPLHQIHLRNMLTLSKMGVIIAPPVPAFYNAPQNIDDIINHSTGRVLDLFDIDIEIRRWQGI